MTGVREPSEEVAAPSSMGRRRTRARLGASDSYQQRRQDIARAAAAVFNDRGFQGTSLGAVAAELGLDRATLYYYIGSKQELFDEVVRRATEANVARAEAIRHSEQSPAAKVRALVLDLMASYARNYPLLYVYIRENLKHVAGGRSAWAAHMRGLNRRYQEAVVAMVQEGIDDGSFRSLASAEVIAFGILGMVGWTNRWYVPGRFSETAEEVGAAYADLILTGLQS